MGIVVVTPPAAFPVTLSEAKKQAEVAPSLAVHDDHLNRLIAAATDVAEDSSKRAFINRTLKLTLQRFPCWHLGLPYPPLQSVSSVKYIDDNGVLQTLATSEYNVSTNNQPGFIEPAYNKTWPSTRRQADAVQVEYVAGYGASGAAVPAKAREAILLLLNTWFNNREGAVVGVSANDVPLNVKWLLQGLKTGTYPGWFDPAFIGMSSIW